MDYLLFKRYDKEKYTIVFNQATGFFARIEDRRSKEPLYSNHGPELLDISITSNCDRDCYFCYRNLQKTSNVMTLEDYEFILKQAVKCGVLQIALGGGNPNQHRDFEKILEITRLKYNIVPSYTTNGDGLTKDILNASKKYCGAVAISFYKPYKLFYSNLNILIKAGIKTNVHFMLSSKTIKSAINILSNNHQKFAGVNALIFLLYKPAGKANKSEILRMSPDVEHFFSLVNTSKLKIGFDSCSIPGIVNHLDYNSITVEACEAGRFSAFISEDLMLYPCSFMENQYEGINLRENSILDAWVNSSLFYNMRIKNSNTKCKKCLHFSTCKGGCRIFKEINLCN